MTPIDRITEARRQIGLALGEHDGAEHLDEPTRLLLEAVKRLDLARLLLAKGAKP
jgi:hypothetical protein